MNKAAEKSLQLPLDIVFLLQDLEFGGTQRYTLHVLEHLNRELFTPHLWVLCGKADMAPLARAAGVEPVWLSRTKWVGPHSIAALASRLIRYRPRLLYTLTVVPNIWGRLFGSAVRVPTIVSSWRGLYPKQYESVMWRLCTRLICNANILKQVIMERHAVPPERIAVIRNGVRSEIYTPDPTQKSPFPSVVYVGRLVPDKAPMTLLEGFRIAAAKMPEARFEIVGNGHLAGQAREFIDRHGLKSRITMIPGQDDTRPYLRRSWVFAMSSIREASPNVILEAMSTELPVVAPRVGGIPELVQDGKTGIVFEQSKPEALADAIAYLLNHEKERIAMGEAARRRVLDFHSVDAMVRETERVLLEAAGERDQRP